MGYYLGLIVALTALWLGLSGLYKTLILSLGVVSIILSVILAYRFDILDAESSPYGKIIQIGGYWVWLVGEIMKANWIVVKACLKSDLDINPSLVKVRTRCESDLARTVFANSITLTPGTVSIQIEQDKVLVHALYEEEAGPDAFAEMDRRSVAAVDGRARA